MQIFAPLKKAVEKNDGTLTIEGYASTEGVDASGETVAALAIKAALPEYFRHGSGPLREMHQLKAAGRVDVAEIDSQNRTRIVATVVDPGAIKKVLERVYNGFSIGGKTLERDPINPKKIIKLRLDEISLVDRPANSDSTFEIIKAAGAPDRISIMKDVISDMTEPDRVMLLIKASHKLPVKNHGFRPK
jgi:hypothetical protein